MNDTNDRISAYKHIVDLIESDSNHLDTFGTQRTPHPEGRLPVVNDCGVRSDPGSTARMWAASPEKLPRDTLIACSKEPQNDTGNGQRLLKWFGPDLLYVRDVGWHIWTGTHWNHEGGDQIVTMLAQGTAARIALEADVMPPSLSEKQMIEAAEHAHPTLEALEKERGADAKKDSRWASLVRIVAAGEQAAVALAGRKENRRKYSISSGNTGKIRGMLEQALPHRTVTVDELDSEPLAFNVENGTLRFVYDEVADPDASDYSEQMIKCYRVELYPHKRGDNISKVAPVVFDPNARCPTFDNAVARFLPLGSVREFVQRYQGYALTGLTGEQCFVFNYGTGSNWKSTFIEIVSRIMGPYCATIAFESLAGDQQRSGSQATPDLARLPGARLVRASEPERGVQFREALIKSLTGGEPMLVRSLNKEFFEFRPTFKLVLSGNHKPEISGVDHGIWRRVNFVPWPVTISSQEKRPMDEVMKELWAERSGILNWLVEGTLAYLNEGLQTPQEVIDATADYREEMDPVGTFVAQCIVTEGPPADGSEPTYVFARKLYDAFAAWAVANAVRPWREKSFAVAMSQKGFVKEKHRTGMRYLNILLHDVPEPSRRRSDIPAHPDDSDVVPA